MHRPTRRARHRLGRAGLSVSAALVLLAAPAQAASRPDFTGMWQFEFSNWKPLAAPHAPQLTPPAQALLDHRLAAEQKHGYVRQLQNILCLPTAFPMMMMWRSPIEIATAPGRLSIVTEHDPGNDEPRTIYLTEPTQPSDVDPSWNGHSIGKWDGAALVIDTVGFNDRAGLFGGVPRTPMTHIVERLTLIDHNKSFIDTMTMTDPATLTAPWTVAMKFDRLPDTAERLEAVCEPDIDALKALDLNAIKDVDPEAARMIDPATHYNAVGNQYMKETK